MWYELGNEDYKELKDYVQENSMKWDEFWNDNLWWNTETRDRQRNYYRNGDIVQIKETGKTKKTGFEYTVNTYIPEFSISSGCIIMEWNEEEES
jgi:hypothetical protein